MRVTNSMLITNMLSNLNTNLNTMSRKQDELATGKKVIFASDNPVAAAKILKFKTDIADMYQYSTNTRDANAWLDATESTVAEMGTVLQRVRELAVKAANGTNTAEDTKKIREEIVQLKDHLISSGNFNFAGRYIFSSHHTDLPLLDKDGNYNIPITQEDLDTKPVAVYEVSVKERMPVGTHGVDLFGFDPDTTAYQSKMPDNVSTNGRGAQKAAVQVDFKLDHNYSADPTTSITVDGTAFTLLATDKAKLNGTTVKPLDPQAVLDIFRNTVNGSVKLSDKADVYFDANNKLVVRSKTLGTGSGVTLSAFSGMSNPKNITNPDNITTMANVTDAVAGLNSVAATVTVATPTPPTPPIPPYASADRASFLGKQFVMTFNGLTKTIQIPSTGIANDADLKTAIQTKIDDAFGAGKVSVATLVDGSPITFSTVTAPTDPVKPVLRVQPVKGNVSTLIKDMKEFATGLLTADSAVLGGMMAKMDVHLNQLLAVRADIGARGSRLELIDTRIAENNITFTRLLSDAQDADMSEVIMGLKNAGKCL